MNHEKKRLWICGTTAAIVFAALCLCPSDALPQPWNSLLAIAACLSAFAYCLFL